MIQSEAEKYLKQSKSEDKAAEVWIISTKTSFPAGPDVH